MPSRRHVVKVGASLVAAPALLAAGRPALARQPQGGQANAKGATDPHATRDLPDQHPKPPFERQPQEPPGLASKAELRPDQGGQGHKGPIPVDLVHGRAKLREVHLHYVTAGRGEAVVLLHGFPQTWFTWRRVIPALAEKYTVIAPDLRGVGDSTRPQGGYDKRTAAGDIRELVRALGHERVRLVGHDVGGWVAYPYAATYPQEVERLVILQALAPGYGLQRNMQDAWHFRFHMEPDLPEALVSGRERMYLDYFLSNGLHDRSAIGPEALDEYVRCFSKPGAARAFFNYYRALPQDARDNEGLAKKKLPMPVLALGGEFGEGTSVLDSVKQVAEDVRGGIVERAGHFIPEERPDQLVELMLDFFKR